MIKFKVLISALLFGSIFCVEPLFAKDIYTVPFGGDDPRIAAQGGGLSTATGSSSLSGNPAAFALKPYKIKTKKPKKKDEKISLSGILKNDDISDNELPNSQITILGTSYTGSTNIENLLPKLVEGDLDAADDLSSILQERSILNMGAKLELSYVGNGLGLGIFATPTIRIQEEGATGITSTHLIQDITGVLGYSYNFEDILKTKLGELSIAIGMSIRPTYRLTYTDQTIIDTVFEEDLGSFIDFSNSTYTTGYDIGTIIQLDHFDIGLSFRDIGGTKYSYDNFTTRAPATMFLGISSDFSAYLSDDFRKVFWPRVYMEYEQPIGLDDLILGSDAEKGGINIGTSLDFFDSWLSIRGGVHKGHGTYGLGLNLRALVINFAYYSQHIEALDTDAPKYALEIAFRY